MKTFSVIFKWSNNKETRYTAPSSATSKEHAVFEVLMTWPFDFKDSNRKVTSVVVNETSRAAGVEGETK